MEPSAVAPLVMIMVVHIVLRLRATPARDIDRPDTLAILGPYLGVAGAPS